MPTATARKSTRKSTEPTERRQVEWAALLKRALTVPGVMSEAYRVFHRYSILNQQEILVECMSRGIQPGPIATYKKWQELGRQVRKGERALGMWQPITKKTTTTDPTTGEEKKAGYMFFMWRNAWFVLSQTDGADYTPEPLPDWDITRALDVLNIQRVPFEHTDGNVQGYAHSAAQTAYPDAAGCIAVSPITRYGLRTMIHEMAHVLHGHVEESRLIDWDNATPKNIMELEAESVALLVCSALGLPGEEESRAYIQSWYQGEDVPDRSAQRIFRVANAILKAGQVGPDGEEE